MPTNYFKNLSPATVGSATDKFYQDRLNKMNDKGGWSSFDPTLADYWKKQVDAFRNTPGWTTGAGTAQPVWGAGGGFPATHPSTTTPPPPPIAPPPVANPGVVTPPPNAQPPPGNPDTTTNPFGTDSFDNMFGGNPSAGTNLNPFEEDWMQQFGGNLRRPGGGTKYNGATNYFGT